MVVDKVAYATSNNAFVEVYGARQGIESLDV